LLGLVLLRHWLEFQEGAVGDAVGDGFDVPRGLVAGVETAGGVKDPLRLSAVR
jgi:hypothetical protein